MYLFCRFPVIIVVSVVLPTSAVFKPSFNEDDVFEFLQTLYSKDHGQRTAYFERWKNAKVNIAIMGNAAVGKSTFINKIRGVRKRDPGYAKVGVGGTTTVPTPYLMPKNEKIVFWDTPGLDTPDFLISEAIFDSWGVDEYDYVLMFYATSIHMSEIKITKMLKARHKNVAFVRTKIDELKHEDHEMTIIENIKKIKEDGKAILRDHRIGNDVRLFAISNHMMHLGDFDELVNHILNSLNDIKFKSLLLSLESFSEKIINRKKKEHLNDVWKVCLAVGTINGLPLPVIDVAIYSGLLKYYVDMYMESFKLDPASLRKLPVEIQSQLTLSATISTIGVIPYLTKELGKRFAAKAGQAIAAKVAENILEFIPVIGPLISGSASYGLCYSYLESLIIELSNEALFVYNHNMYQEFKRMNDFTRSKDEL